VAALALAATVMAHASTAFSQERGLASLPKVVAFTNGGSDSKVKIEWFAIREGTTVVVTFTSAALVGPGLTTDVVVGDPSGAQSRTRLEVRDPDVTATMATGSAGKFGEGKPAGGRVVGNATVELEVPKGTITGDASIWASAFTVGGDRYRSPIFRLTDLISGAPGRLPSPWGWASTADPPVATNVPGVPVLASEGGGLKVSFVRGPPKESSNVAANRVVDSVFIRIDGMTSKPAVLEIDEQTSAVRLRKPPEDEWVKVDAASTNPAASANGTVPVQKGSELTISPKSLESALGRPLPADAWISLTRVMFLADGNRVEFAGVAVTSSTAGTPAPSFSIQPALDSKVLWAVVGTVIVVLLLSLRSFWQWLRETEWWQFGAGPHRLRILLRRRARRPRSDVPR
jgi:hypothetical protein